jgi:hypothetical protein
MTSKIAARIAAAVALLTFPATPTRAQAVRSTARDSAAVTRVRELVAAVN